MPQNITTGYKALCEDAEREIETLSADQAVELAGRDDTVLVDIRDIRELEREGRVPGAFHCPRGMLSSGLIRKVRITSRFSARTRSSCFFAPAVCAERSLPRPHNAWASNPSRIFEAVLAPGKRQAGPSGD